MSLNDTQGASYRPLLFESDTPVAGSPSLDELRKEAGKSGKLLDLFASQKKELFRIETPARTWESSELDKAYSRWLGDRNPDREGTWVYYPWSGRLLHILDRNEFIRVRTTRNFYKITPAEQTLLAGKTIGIIGLSVGHAVALTIASERICGKLKLADFDTLELSNLNRIRAGLHQTGLNKCIVTAREIAELDPYLDLECYTQGLDLTNLEAFLTEGGPLDLLIDECDDLSMKITCRLKARELRIPVLMETSDKGMLDVERFDREPDRPVLHGLLDDVALDTITPSMTQSEKIPIVLKITNATNSSVRGRASMIEIGQSISTWPQLASAVTLGGSLVTDTGRRILLGQFNRSGRYYIDLEQLVADPAAAAPANGTDSPNPFQPMTASRAATLAGSATANGFEPDKSVIETVVKAACQAPSTGNDQPWKWYYRQGTLSLLHDPYRAFSFGNFHNIASCISLGACFENLLIESDRLGYDVASELTIRPDVSDLIGTFRFSPRRSPSENRHGDLARAIYLRETNRNLSEPAAIAPEMLDALKANAESIPGASLRWLTDRDAITALGEIIGGCDLIRLLNPEGHRDFVNREMRWTPEAADLTGDGIDIRTLGLRSAEATALKLVEDPRIIEELKRIDGGKALVQVAVKTMKSASAIGLITLPRYRHEDFFEGGRAMQRLWLQATLFGLALHPVISPLYLFPRVLYGNGSGLDAREIALLQALRERFLELFPVGEGQAEVFLFKIAKAPVPAIKSRRLPLSETLFYF